jgi:hypothetical protein
MKRKKRLNPEKRFPIIDLNDQKKLKAFIYILIGTVGFLLISAFENYIAYEFTDSDSFCGEVCHTGMLNLNYRCISSLFSFN